MQTETSEKVIKINILKMRLKKKKKKPFLALFYLLYKTNII